MVCETNAKNWDCDHPKKSQRRSNGYIVCSDCGECLCKQYEPAGEQYIYCEPFDPLLTYTRIKYKDARKCGWLREREINRRQIIGTYRRKKILEGFALIEAIGHNLELSPIIIKQYKNIFERIYPKIKKNTTLRELDILVPLIMYHFRRDVEAPITFNDMSDITGFTKGEMWMYMNKLHRLLINWRRSLE